jgi:hypothetical protein
MKTPVFLITSQTDSTYAISGTYYFACASGVRDGSTETTEANVQITYRTAGVLSHLLLQVITNTITATSTLVTRVNGANGNQSVSVGASQTGTFRDTAKQDVIAVGDEVNYQLTAGGTGTAITLRNISTHFTSSDGAVMHWYTGSSSGVAITADSTSYYNVVQGPFNITTTVEADSQIKFFQNGTWKNLFVYISANTRSTATTFTARKGASNTSLTLSVTASTTGIFEDSSNTVGVVYGEYLNYITTTSTGGGSITVQHVSSEFVGDAEFPCILAASTTTTFSLGTVAQNPLGGIPFAGGGGANSYIVSVGKYVFKNVWIKVTANTGTGTNGWTALGSYYYESTTGENDLPMVSITNGATGEFENTSTRGTSFSPDLIYISNRAPGSGNISYKAITLTAFNPASTKINQLRPRAFAPGLAR